MNLFRCSDLPEGLAFTHLKQDDAQIVAKHWKYTTPGSVEQDKHMIANYPSVGVRELSTNRLVAWIIMYYDMSFSKANVLPEYRNRGVIKCIVQEMMLRVQKLGSECFFGFIDVNNDASLTAMKNCFINIFEERFVWVSYEPNSKARYHSFDS